MGPRGSCHHLGSNLPWANLHETDLADATCPAGPTVQVVTTFFPNSAQPRRTLFVKNLVVAMRRLCRVNIIAPLPWAPPGWKSRHWSGVSRVPRRETVDGIELQHPRFLAPPALSVLHGLGFGVGVLGPMRRAALADPDLVVHVHCAFPDGVGAALAARVLGLRYVITAHGSDINVHGARALLRRQIRWALRHASGVIAVSGALREKVVALIPEIAARTAVIPCAGFDPSNFLPRNRIDCRAKLGLSTEDRIVLFIGNLVPVKGLNVLLKAWAKLRTGSDLGAGAMTLVLVGEGQLRGELQQLAQTLGIAAEVRFVGGVPQSQVASWIGAANLVCLPSHSEGMPNVVVESLASAVPVVATAVGGIPDIIVDGENGYLTQPGDADALAAVLRRALSATWDHTRIARSAEKMTWATLARKNVEFIKSLNKEPIACQKTAPTRVPPTTP
jgi:teichuronic acid biosynthesis glycosyltransferase TuaC